MIKNILPLLFIAVAQLLKAQGDINMAQIATGYSSPVDIKNCNDDRLFVVEQAGYIRILNKNGTKQTTPFLDIHTRVNSSGNEQGLLSLAFSPTYKQDGYFYVNYINGSGSGSTRISRFSVLTNDSTQADPNSEVILLTFSQPYTNHNGSTLMFGKDGYLYDTQGDGGSGSDPQGNGQNKNVLLGKILRLDVSNPDTTYTIPASNPFVGQANTRAEIWAYGVRNPWRCSFDRITGDMWIGDVGQDAYEEVDFQSVTSIGGENYGWRCREGLHACPNCTTTGCPSTGFVDPVSEQPQSNGSCSMTGGYVYRGAQYTKLFGTYLHSDFCSGKIYAITNNGNNTFTSTALTVYVNGSQTYLTNNIGTFGEDNLGELYIAGRSNGRIYKITETTDCKPVAFISLSDTITGCSPVAISALRGDTLTYQWYNSAGIINGANAYQHAVTTSGWYKVNVAKATPGCEAMSDSVYVQIKDTTAINAGTGQTAFCQNEAAVALTSYLQPSGGLYSGPGVSSNMFNPGLVSSSTVNLQYTYTNLQGCVAHAQFVLQIKDTVALIKNSADSVFCITDLPVSLNNFYNYTGQYSGNGVANDDSTFSPASAGVGIVPVSFTTTGNNGCTATGGFSLAVGDTTALAVNVTDSVFCNDEAAISIADYVTPVGAMFSGSGVSGSSFSPSAAGLGANAIRYSYTNAFGCVSQGAFTLTTTACTAIDKIEDKVAFNVYPNPGHGVFNLSVSGLTAQQANLTVTDATGRICYNSTLTLTGSKQTTGVNLSALADGTYTINLKGNLNSYSRILVIK